LQDFFIHCIPVVIFDQVNLEFLPLQLNLLMNFVVDPEVAD